MKRIIDFEINTTQEFPVSWFDSDLKNFFVVTVKGEALAPLYCEGDTVFIKCDVLKYREGVTYYVEVNGHCELRQLCFGDRNDNIISLISPSPFMAPLRVHIKNVKIIGIPYMILRKCKTEGL